MPPKFGAKIPKSCLGSASRRGFRLNPSSQQGWQAWPTTSIWKMMSQMLKIYNSITKSAILKFLTDTIIITHSDNHPNPWGLKVLAHFAYNLQLDSTTRCFVLSSKADVNSLLGSNFQLLIIGTPWSRVSWEFLWFWPQFPNRPN